MYSNRLPFATSGWALFILQFRFAPSRLWLCSALSHAAVMKPTRLSVRLLPSRRGLLLARPSSLAGYTRPFSSTTRCCNNKDNDKPPERSPGESPFTVFKNTLIEEMNKGRERQEIMREVEGTVTPLKNWSRERYERMRASILYFHSRWGADPLCISSLRLLEKTHASAPPPRRCKRQDSRSRTPWQKR
jgi:hypothetical protein